MNEKLNKPWKVVGHSSPTIPTAQWNVILCEDDDPADSVGIFSNYSSDTSFAEHVVALHNAALSTDAEPVAWRYRAKGDEEWRDATLVEPSKDHKHIVSEPLYAAPPAPAVAVKALEWEVGEQVEPLHKADFYTIEGQYRQGYALHTAGLPGVTWYGSLEEAKAAAQADYEARIRSALSAQVQDVGVDATLNEGALNALKNNQRQLDADGCEVGVSRQALNEALAFINSVRSAQVQDLAVQDVIDELRRQVEVEGWSAAHDDTHDKGEMAGAAACYALAGVTYVAPDHYPPRKKYAAVVDARNSISEKERETTREAIKLALGEPSAPKSWPWDASWWKPSNARRNLVKAAALLISEIKRIDRAAAPASKQGETP